MKKILKFLCLFLMYNSRILSVFELTRNSIFCCKQHNYNFSYLTTAIEERVAERGWPILWRQIKSLETQNVQIFPFVNLINFCSYKSLCLNNECRLR